MDDQFRERAKKIKWLFTDCDGVLTDAGVYYSAEGEMLKKFNIRDGMGVERLRKIANIETGIITGEQSHSVAQRAKKLKIEELHLFVKDKIGRLEEICKRLGLSPEEIAYIGDDVNDLGILERAGLTACPADGVPQVKEKVDYICLAKGGHGAFREFAEWIIQMKMRPSQKPAPTH